MAALAGGLCLAVHLVGMNGSAFAQAPSGSQNGTTTLPPLEVQAKKPAAKKAKQKAAPAPAAPAPAVAQPAPAPKSAPAKAETGSSPVKGFVATVSATGTKTDTPLIETPQSISVITADRINQQGATSVSDALGYTAGVRAGVYGADTRFDWLTIRGFDAYLPGFFIDGMLARNNNTWSVWKVEPYGAERIEVLKGPPSVLYGQANVGGMVNVISKRPLDEPLREVEVKVGNNHRVESMFDFSGPVTTDGKLLYRLTGVVLDTETDVDFTEQERVYIAPAVTWRPNADTSITLLGQYLKEDSIPNNRFLPAKGTLQPNDPYGKISRSFFTGEPDYDRYNVEQWSIGYLLQHRIDDVWQVRQNLRYREMDVDYRTVYGTGWASGSQTELTRSVFVSNETLRAFTVDNQVQADFTTGAVKHTVLAGLDYQNTQFGQATGFGGAETINPYDPVYGTPITDPKLTLNDTTLSQTGIYLQEQAKIDRWIFTLGGRYDWAENDTKGSSQQEDEAFTWKAAVLYLTPGGFAPYYSYSESFFPLIGTDYVTKQPFKPETGQQHEVGIKYQPPGTKSLYTLAAFDITRQNYTTTVPDSQFQQSQTGEIRSRGLEFEAVAELAPGLDLAAAYTWLADFEITESSEPKEIGKRQPTVPEHMASLWLHYRLQHGPLAGFGFGGGVRYIGETFGNIANSADMKVPDYTLFDGVLDYEKDGWRYALNVNNIADETILTCWDTCYYGTGRSIIASIRRRW